MSVLREKAKEGHVKPDEERECLRERERVREREGGGEIGIRIYDNELF